MIAISIFFSPVCSINIYSSTWHWSLFSSICATDLLYKYWQCSEHVFAGFCENFSNTPCQCRHLVWEVQVSCSSAPKAALKCDPPHATMFSCSAFSSSGWPLWRIKKHFEIWIPPKDFSFHINSWQFTMSNSKKCCLLLYINFSSFFSITSDVYVAYRYSYVRQFINCKLGGEREADSLTRYFSLSLIMFI